MYTRRDFASLILGVLGASALFGPLGAVARRAWAASKKVLTKATTRQSLIGENPAYLDTTDMAITPLDEFETMGPTDQAVDLATWRLEVAGLVKRPGSFTYAELTALPTIEREVLLICPGFFANHGRWKGVSIARLLRQADVDSTATRVTIAEARGKTAQLSPGRCPVRQGLPRHPCQRDGSSPQARLPASRGGRRLLRRRMGEVCRSAHGGASVIREGAPAAPADARHHQWHRHGYALHRMTHPGLPGERSPWAAAWGRANEQLL